MIISEHPDRIFDIKKPTYRDAASLLALISTVSDANKALESLRMSKEMWDCLLVHHISRHLDKAKREAWESSLGSSREYPRFANLGTSLTTWVRALERIESLPATSSNGPRPTHSKKSATAHQTSAKATTQDSRFHCNCCNSNHVIVTCFKFRDLMVADRPKVTVDKRLCYNCLCTSARPLKSAECALHVITPCFMETPEVPINPLKLRLYLLRQLRLLNKD